MRKLLGLLLALGCGGSGDGKPSIDAAAPPADSAPSGPQDSGLAPDTVAAVQPDTLAPDTRAPDAAPAPVDMAPLCRQSTEACAATADCCQGLICQANRCGPPPPPPPPDAAPPPPDVSPPPPDVMPAPMDCTAPGVACPAGQVCSGLTKQCMTPTGSMLWTFSHLCPNGGRSIEIRLFDVTHQGVWPSTPGQVFVLPYATTKDVAISCFVGAKVCFGARDQVSFWGLDIDASQSCMGCCYTCGGGAIPIQNLRCQ